MEDLGFTTNVEVIQRFLSLEGKSVVDVGCGSMAFTRHLADLGANALAIDPDPIQAEKNRAEDPIPNIDFVETGAETIPVKDRSMDGVFFSYSLHHIPAEIYPVVFDEVFRVLRPDGFLYVIEPIGCPWNDVMKLFHDEEVERAAAWLALEQIAIPRFESCDLVTYHGYSEYESWEAFANHFANRSFNSLYSETDVRRPEVEEAFELLGGPNHRFQSPKNVMCLKRVKK